MRDDVVVLGSNWLPIGPGVDTQIDESVFACCEAALRDAGVRRHEVGLSITTSMDLYDARSISNAMTAPAAGGYLGDELRVEGDVSSALLLAADNIRARQAEIAMVVAINIPEIASAAEKDLRGLAEKISSYTFDSHLDRPIGMTSATSLALHASHAVDKGWISVREMAECTAADIGRSDRSRGARRAPVTVDDVLDAPAVATPLTEWMLPALTSAVGAVVLASEPRARRAPRPRARLTGYAAANSGTTWTDPWLENPAHAALAAGRRALGRAGFDRFPDDPTVVTMTDLTPALRAPTLAALGAVGVPADRINPDGGVRANYPGLGNGLLRLLTAVDALSAGSGPAAGRVAVVHSTDNLAGLMSATTTVLVLEGM